MFERASLYVDSHLLHENISKLRSLVGSKEIIPMVKAQGYGHGAVDISRILLENKMNYLGVASLTEAIELRHHLQGKFEIIVFSDTQLQNPESLNFYKDFRITPVISNDEDLSLFLNSKDFKHFPLYLKFNTGMNRLGLDPMKVDDICKKIKASGRMSIAHVMSHFACASQDIKIGHNQRQVESFATLLNEIKAFGLQIEATSLANSGAIEQRTGLEYSHVRPGLMLYGPSSLMPGLESAWDGRIISSLKVRVLQTRLVKKGDPVGYGLTPVSRDGLLLIAAAGYGDGFNNRYQKVSMTVKTSRGDSVDLDVVGRVNMDMVQLLAPVDCSIKSSEVLTFWDDDPRAFDQFCLNAKTIPYEVFCQLSVRIPRIFKLP